MSSSGTDGDNSRNGVAERLLGTISLQSVDLGLRILQQLVTIPVLIAYWGPSAYQDWVVLAAAANFFLLLDLGMQTYFVNSLLIALTRNDGAGFRRMIGIAMLLHGIILLAAGGLLTAIGASTAWPAYLGLRTLTEGQAQWTGGVLLFSLITLMPLGIFTGVYRVRGDYGCSVLIGMLTQTFPGFALCVIAAAGGTLPQAAALHLGVTACAWTVVALDQKRRYGEFSFRIAIPTRVELKDAVTHSLQYAAPAVAAPIVLHLPVVLLGMWAPAGAAISYTIARTLTGFVRQLTLQPNLPIGTEVARLFALREKETVRKLFSAAARLTCAVSGLFAGFMAVAAEPILRLWTHGQIAYDAWLVGVFIASIVVMAPAQAPTTLFQHINRPRVLALANLGFVAGTIVLCLVLVGPLKALGAAIGVSLAEALTIGCVTPFAACALISLPSLVFVRECLGALAAALALGYAAAWSVAAILPADSMTGVLTLAVVWALVVCLPAFFCLLSRDLRGVVLRLAAQRLRKREPSR